MPSTVRLYTSASDVTAHKGTGGDDAQREEELEAKRVREVRAVDNAVWCCMCVVDMSCCLLG